MFATSSRKAVSRQAFTTIHLALLGMVAAASVAGCQGKGGAASGSGPQSPPVATVNGVPISRDFFEFYVRGVAGRSPSELTAAQRDQALDNLIRGELVVQQSEKDGLARDPQTVDMLELARFNVFEQAASRRYLKDRRPTEEELRAEYETQVALLPHEEYHARHILVATEPYANKLIEQLDKGANFADLAKKESMDSSKDNGGDLGWFSPERMVPEFAQAVVALKPGQYTHKAIHTQYGWHIIKLEETRDVTPPPYDSVRQRLVQIVEQKKFRAYEDSLMKNAKIERKTS
ncbi:MAG TPA: peptidylprolyl isomerase [Steroidobacteraceae bacterium]|nr:peptidylprolyl isomerase [Steroidobacteraceae bacterium]